MPEHAVELSLLQHTETRLLYTEGLQITAEQIQQILALPRTTLIADLETILADSKDRFNYYDTLLETVENTNFQDAALHAIMLLGELKAMESLSVILNWLIGPDDFLDFWIGDHITETIWEPLFKLLPGDTAAIEAFLTNAQANEFARAAVTAALAQLVIHQPEHRPYVLSIFQNTFDYFLQQPAGDNESFLGLAVSEAVNIQASELLPVIEKLFDAKLIDEFARGTKEEIQAEMQEGNDADAFFKAVLPVEERYQQILTTWPGYTQKDYSTPGDKVKDWEEDDPITTPATIVRTAPKIGRNDPCPCGSGKKYKKCCLSKLEG